MKKTQKYKTFKTMCLWCDKKLELPQFNIHIGMDSFALCPEHLESAVKIMIPKRGNQI